MPPRSLKQTKTKLKLKATRNKAKIISPKTFCPSTLVLIFQPFVSIQMNCPSIWIDYPGWKNMAAMKWFCHDHTMITAWRPYFWAWSSYFMAWSWYDYHVFNDSYLDHDMIIIFSIFFWTKNGLFINFFSNSWRHVALYVKLDWFWRNFRL